ncbi:MAG: LemA family protein [marine benthic group bacterium]|nr:LemA family protein [Candidatus Benthicola marisminoris]
MTWFLIFLAIVAIGGITIYNSLVKLRTQAQGAWADIDVQLKRRWDLIPNLVETVKGYASHEKDTLEAVINARNRAMSATGPADKAQAENMLTGALKSLFALSEAYPDLKAVEGFTQLQGTLDEIEGAVQSSRRYYNAVVRDYNTKVEQFPSVLVANAFRFQKEEFFELDDEAQREAPTVSFGDSGG